MTIKGVARTMKALRIILLVCLPFAWVSAQERAYLTFKNPGDIAVGGGFYFQFQPKTITSPKFIFGEYVLIPNLSAGPQIAHFSFKDYRDVYTQKYVTNYPTDKIKINQFTIGLKTTYYLNDIITNAIGLKLKKTDFHVTGFGGLNLLSGVDTAHINRDSVPSFGYSIMVGAGYQYNKSLGFFFQVGYSRYGIIAFGAKYIIAGKYEQE